MALEQKTKSPAPNDKQKPKRSLFDHLITLICFLILGYFVINEFSHLYRSLDTVDAAPDKFERHITVSSTFPFVGSYFLIKPKNYDTRYSYPLVVALHGISKRVYAAEGLLQPSFRDDYPVFVMIPVAPKRAFWATPRDKAYQMERNIPYPDHLPQVMAGIKHIEKNYQIDPSRVYIVGHSAGASGVIGALERYPDIFAAGIASSGVWDAREASHIKTPLWIVHGTQDKFIPYNHSVNLVRSLKARGAPVVFSPMEGEGHGIGSLVYGLDASWDWLFQF